MKCATCGAPIEAGMEKCPYCGSTTSYGETLLEEKIRRKENAERQKRIENLPRMKFVSGAFIPLLYFFTLCWYAPIWYGLRMRSLNALNPPHALPAWAVGLYNLTWLAIIILSGWEEQFGLTPEQGKFILNSLLGVATALSMWLALLTRSILQSYAAKFLEGNIAVHTVAPSNVLLLLFGPMYLQYQINNMISMELLAPQI
ncbi:MAG: hypothetical protein K6E38_07255 [Fretibacterium sp.]|nr:hypothetical protein [Fretibacterium sp.]